MRIEDSGLKLTRLCLAASVWALAGGCADLVVTDVHHEPWLGAQRLIKAKVKNEGWRDAPASGTRLDVKLASSTTYTRSATINTPALARGQEVELPLSPLLPTELPAAGSGQCLELRVCADAEDAVGEGWFWESNNCRTGSTCR